jgi:hypothetical protein
MQQNAPQVLRDAAAAYEVDVDAIALKVKQEFAEREDEAGKEARREDSSSEGQAISLIWRPLGGCSI